jgi:hypothetical protein
VPRLVPRVFVVERHLMHNSEIQVNKNNDNKSLVPCLMLRLLLVEWHLVHNSNKVEKYINKNYSKKSGALSGAAAPCW